MTTPKNPTPEEIVTNIFNTFLGGAAPKTPGTSKPEVPVANPLEEAQRLLTKAEKASDDGSFNQANHLLEIADRQIRILETAMAYQK